VLFHECYLNPEEAMKMDILLGLQWGDEGKGKIVDFLTPHYDVIARFQGGPNAGHTLEFEGRKQILHTIPSGIFHKEKTNLIGNGVIIDPLVLEKEINQLRLHGLKPEDNLLISKRAHLILPTHLLLDAVYEKSKGNNKIGSTLKGIGPTYTDKTCRNGIRIGDIHSGHFSKKYQELKKHHLTLASLYCTDLNEISLHGLTLNEYEERWMDALELLRTLQKTDSEYFINDCMRKGKKILAEGAQGTLLDLDFGSYPFVTSSNTIAAGVCSGLGVPPSAIGKVFGIFKAYCTRVGSGPFPTEIFDEQGEMLRQQGHEFGSTTGRPRRCGWLDLPALKYAVMLNGVTHLFMMKADVLNKLPELLVCNAYKTPEGEIDHMTWDVLEQPIEPLYSSIPGWQQELDNSKSFDELPETLINYIRLIEEVCSTEIPVLSIGPDREQTIIKQEFLEAL
jgi:adenylosuccinate synthase